MIGLLTVALLGALLAFVAPAQAQQDPPPTNLWEEYPLETAPQPGAAQGESGERGEPAAGEENGDGGGSDVVMAALAALGIAAVAVIAGGLIASRRRGRPRAARRAGAGTAGETASAARATRAGAAARAASAPPQVGAAAANTASAARPAGAGAPAGAASARAQAGASAAGTASAPARVDAGPAAGAARPSSPAGDGTAKSASAARRDSAAAAAGETAGTGVAGEAAAGTAAKPLTGERAIGYTTFADGAEASGPQGRLQQRLIEAACVARGLVLHRLVGEVQSNPSAEPLPPGLAHALDSLAAREATCLVVASLNQMTGRAARLGPLIRMLDERDARLVVIDVDLDTATLEGRARAQALTAAAAPEPSKAEKRAVSAGQPPTLERRRRRGRPSVSDHPELERRIRELRASGMTLEAIASTLNSEGVPTLRGGAKWRPSSVQAALGYKRPKAKRRAARGDGP